MQLEYLTCAFNSKQYNWTLLSRSVLFCNPIHVYERSTSNSMSPIEILPSLTPQPLPLLPGYLNYPDPSYTHKQDYHLLILIPWYKLPNHTWHSLPKEPFNSLILTSGVWLWLHHSFAQNSPEFSLYSKSLSIFTSILDKVCQGSLWLYMWRSGIRFQKKPQILANRNAHWYRISVYLSPMLSPLPKIFWAPPPKSSCHFTCDSSSSATLTVLYFSPEVYCALCLMWLGAHFMCDFPFESQATKGQYQLAIIYCWIWHSRKNLYNWNEEHQHFPRSD